MVEEEIIRYWDRRGKNRFEYKGELFYTLTPIPLYFERQKILRDKMGSFFNTKESLKILDFGCGDGKHLEFFSNKFPQHHYYGCDISTGMIEEAKKISSQSKGKWFLSVCDGKIPFQEKFDIIFTIAVFQHILDEKKLIETIDGFYNHLKTNGKVVIFEATGNNEKSGQTWIRREPGSYHKLFSNRNFDKVLEKNISFPIFQFFDEILLSRMRSHLFLDGYMANKNKFYRKLCEFLIHIDILIKIRPKKYSGNSLFVFKRI